MTKLRIASDFHLEFYDYVNPIGSPNREITEHVVLPVMPGEDEQTLILAGDIVRAIDAVNGRLGRFQTFFDRLSERFKNVIIVAGNHEFYNYDFDLVYDELEEFYGQWKNFHFLQNDVFVDDAEKIVIFGATFWTNFWNDPVAMEYAKVSMSDFIGIIQHKSSISGKFTPELSTFENMVSLDSLHKEFFAGPDDWYNYDGYSKIVVTHHAPHAKSTAPKFIGSMLNPAFSSTNLEDYIIENKPKLWIHGHMHNNSDYYIGDTRIICNPYGYYSENKTNYINTLVIEV